MKKRIKKFSKEKRSAFVHRHADAVFQLAVLYARKYFMETEDLYQEGLIGVLTAFDEYRTIKSEAELNRLAKTLANRFMYRFVKSEIIKRNLCVQRDDTFAGRA
jgi:DNA-directed RNA polymerase specialized sigma24 family protein